ncbi:hypothetical protein ACFL5Z_18525 [Planctomycetota bacterium]
MNNHKTTLSLVAFFAIVMFFVGCLPETSLKWSDDGSVGLLMRVNDGLYLVCMCPRT